MIKQTQKVKAVLRKAPNKIARANVELERKRIRQSNISEKTKRQNKIRRFNKDSFIKRFKQKS